MNIFFQYTKYNLEYATIIFEQQQLTKIKFINKIMNENYDKY